VSQHGEPELDDVATVNRASLAAELAGAAPRTFVVSIVGVSGATDAASAQRVVVDGTQAAPLLIGTSPACALRLSDRQVSRRHASLEPSGERLRIADLGSTNGTFIDGVAIGEAFLRGGELVHVGSTALSVERSDAPPVVVPSRASRFGRLIGASLEMRRLYPLAESLAVAAVPVVIEGETGTGKEVLAESMHEHSPRAAGPWVVFDCTAVPANLIESELFGHERGAFTGASAARKGLFEEAEGGTLFIDEIGDLDIGLQSKLLRAIERSEVRRLGANRALRVDVRVLAATRRNLDAEVQAGRFRDDLFHRLAVGRIELPPLRRRRGDVPVLARHFWTELGGEGKAMTADLLQRWEDYGWPGNVRELRNTVARHLALAAVRRVSSAGADAEPLSAREPAEIDAWVEAVLDERLPLPMARLKVMDEFDRRYIARVLAEHGGNVAHAAAASGVARRYFQLLRLGRRRR
jgi:two-component system, NtrC family, response regulator HydG